MPLDILTGYLVISLFGFFLAIKIAHEYYRKRGKSALVLAFVKLGILIWPYPVVMAVIGLDFQGFMTFILPWLVMQITSSYLGFRFAKWRPAFAKKFSDELDILGRS